MENLNKLSFQTYKINEKKLYIPMEEIKQEFDIPQFSKPYLFKVLYIAKHLKDGNYIIYLGPEKESKLPIVKATIPFEYLRHKKLIPNYNYDRPLEPREIFIINERMYREITKINLVCRGRNKYRGCYVLVFGYLVNKYKDDDALTKVEYGIQEFRKSSKAKKNFKERGYQSSCFVAKDWNKVKKVLNIENERPEFKELPEGFFVDK